MPNVANELLPAVPIQLAPDAGVFELAGTPPVWIWVHTCPTPNCDCRSGLVMGTYAGREKLLERGANVHLTWEAGTGYRKAAQGLDDLVVFDIDIDTAEVSLFANPSPVDVSAYPQIESITSRIDGEVLDAIGRLWYHGKGGLDPEQLMAGATQFKIDGWRPGDLLSWDSVCDVRRDIYRIEGLTYEAFESYCIRPACTCAEVQIGFELAEQETLQSAGSVLVHLSGAVEFNPSNMTPQLLQQLWSAYQRRHPRYLERMVRRDPIMKSVGARCRAVPVLAAPKIGRNDPCACGSGKKYKKCCGKG
jgi:hypothetical protein